MITHHTQLIQYLIDKYGLKSYLEIGVKNPASNYDKIECEYKDGCDPDLTQPDAKKFTIARYESDLYFKKVFDFKEKHGEIKLFDLVFIDGLHHADQVKRDFQNSLHCLNDGGFIIIHDTCPETEKGTEVPRVNKRWWGDVYKFVMNLGQYKGIQYFTLNIDEGITIVWKDATQREKDTCPDCDFDYYNTMKEFYLNIIPPSDLDKYLPDASAVTV